MASRVRARWALVEVVTELTTQRLRTAGLSWARVAGAVTVLLAWSALLGISVAWLLRRVG